MSMTTPPSKILLTNSTKVSLNDRFTKLSKVRAETAPSALAITKNTSPAGRQASAKNRALAAQMAQRPAVQAALKAKQNIKQRLGGGGGGIAPKRLQGPTNPANLARRLSGGGVGGGGGGNLRNRLQFKARPRQRSLPNRQSPRVFTNSKLGGRPQRTPNQNQNRIKKNNNNAGVGGGGGVVPMSTEPIKKSLDMDLDEYMSKTKSHLNADLDSYMAKSKTHLDADLDTYMAQAQSQE